MSDTKKPQRPRSRREFGKQIALLAVASTLGAATPAAADDKQPVKPVPPETLMAVSDAQAEIVRLRYPKHLNEEQLKEVRRQLFRTQGFAERLRQVKLHNGDEPAFTFDADIH